MSFKVNTSDTHREKIDFKVFDREVINERFCIAFPIVLKDYRERKVFIAVTVMGTQLNVLNDCLNGNRKVTQEQIERFIEHYNLNRRFFTLGDSTLYLQAPPSHPDKEEVTKEKRMVGERYKTIRTELDMTQEEISEAVERNQTQWSNIETGFTAPGDDIKSKLHKKFGVTYEYMIDGKPPIRKGKKSQHADVSEERVRVFVNNEIQHALSHIENTRTHK